jgi:hypothetical protein
LCKKSWQKQFRNKRRFDTNGKLRVLKPEDKVLVLSPKPSNELDFIWKGLATLAEHRGVVNYRIKSTFNRSEILALPNTVTCAHTYFCEEACIAKCVVMRSVQSVFFPTSWILLARCKNGLAYLRKVFITSI